MTKNKYPNTMNIIHRCIAVLTEPFRGKMEVAVETFRAEANIDLFSDSIRIASAPLKRREKGANQYKNAALTAVSLNTCA